MTGFAWDAVIFDVDGTLVQSASLHFDAFNGAAERQGARMDLAWYDARKGLDRAGLVGAFVACGLAVSGTALDPDRLMRDSLALTIEKAGVEVVANEPVAALARRLHGRVPLAVGSNAETPVVEAMLRGAGLAGLFDAIVTVSDTARAKPDPAIFADAARRLRAAPSRCLVLEDSDEGLEAARRAGMTGWDVRSAETRARVARLGA